ncbi:prolipoprotein diacylglyceryl transferase [Desulforhopalus singaporensis]|uniref:Phosphatidylglycerol--prolipoprotein diacylglyceryl transferase n=1 Tax=Desulforhopalus singaporensis TaxID=91360 RepID=A0A1H0JMZ6_9BACT|nr:prolipoprotein diacylglyceryl transferase [Desulforhopalus singaporensis]SDO45167.1 phosphatidylglycerol:prolipoprotein diacylglycerol transferase [Desulforhopalus singaporensis]
MYTIPYPQFDPVIFALGPLQVRWYGLMYILGFAASYLLVKKQIRDFSFERLGDHFDNLNMVLILCVVLGGRLGYVFFYNFSYYLAHPLEIPATWQGGMSFHGACIALIAGGLLFCRKQSLNFWKTADIYVATVPVGLFFGRIGNFINGELYGRITSTGIGMVFPGGGPLPRHPSQLYEALLEGAALFVLVWAAHKKPWKASAQNRRLWPHGSILALFLIGYGIFRIVVENFRQPDPQLGFLFTSLTMGQLLSGLMVAAGALLWIIRIRYATI